MKKYILLILMLTSSTLAQDIEPGPLTITVPFNGADTTYTLSKEHPFHSLGNKFILGWHWGADTPWTKAMGTNLKHKSI